MASPPVEPAPAAPAGRTPFPASRIAGFGLPLVLGMGGHALFNLVDLWIVGELGPAALAALTISSLVNTIAMVVVQGMTDGSVALIARAVGAGDYRRAADAARQSLLLALVLGVVLGVPPWIFAEPLTALFGAHGAALEQGTACLRVMSLGSVTMFVLMQAGAALRALGSGKAPAALLVGANLLNVVLAVGLVYGKFGLPAMGVVGACWGTVIARAVFALVGVWLMATSRLRMPIRGGGLRREFLRPLLSLGLPVAGQWFVRLVPVLVVLRETGRVGTAAQAAYGVGSRLDQFAIFACAGWGAAAATAVGQGLGAGDPTGAARAAWRAVVLGVITMAGAAAFFWALAPELVLLIGRDEGAEPRVIALGAQYIRAVALAYPAIGLSLVVSMGLAGGGSARAALAIEATVLLAIQIPLVMASAPGVPGGDLVPVWRAVVLSYAVLAVAYAAVFASGRWKRKEL